MKADHWFNLAPAKVTVSDDEEAVLGWKSNVRAWPNGRNRQGALSACRSVAAPIESTKFASSQADLAGPAWLRRSGRVGAAGDDFQLEH